MTGLSSDTALATSSRADRLASQFSLGLARIGLAGIVVFAFLTIADVVGRELLSRPIRGFSDFAELLFIVSAAACFPAAALQRQHIAVRFIGEALPWRGREILDLLGHVVMLVVFVIIAWRLGAYALDTALKGQTTWILRWPVWPVWTLAALSLATTVPIQALITLQHLRRCFAPRGEDPAPAPPQSPNAASSSARKDID